MKRSPRYVEGWNDRVRGVVQYGKAYRASNGAFLANAQEARAWSAEERAIYVQGWDAACAAIAGLLLPEAS